MKLIQKLTSGYKNLSRRVKALNRIAHFNKISPYAAGACYFMVMATFPALLLVLSILRFTALDARDLFTLLQGVIPAALAPVMEKLILSTYEHASSALLSVSAIAALWSASRSIYGLIVGLNAIYDVKESRGYLYTRSMSVLYMFLFLVVLLLTLLLHVFGQAILSRLTFIGGPVLGFITNLIDIRFVLLFLMQTALFTAMYAALPNRHNPPPECIPGAIFASLGWQLFSVVFSIYVDRVGLYSSIYGSVYAVALCMLWLYCCVFIIFLGGSLNRLVAFERQKKQSPAP